MSGAAEPRDIVVTRTLAAPIDSVWRAWTRSEDVRRWWGPSGFTAPTARMDPRVGGSSLVCMRTPDGHDLFNLWTYQVVQPHECLEFTMEFCDDTGRVVHPADLGLPPDIPVPVRHVVTLTPVDGDATEMTVTEYGYTSEETYSMSRLGLEQCLDKMAASLGATTADLG